LPISPFDLHSHSTRSDGLLPPAEVVERASQRGVEVLALTDHDELSGLPEARAAAASTGIRLINGVEVSVSWNGHTLHIVGLNVDPENQTLVEGLRKNRSGREARAQRIAAQLEGLGIGGAYDGARSYASNPELVSRAHFARYLVERGHAKTTQGIFDRYLGAGKPGYVPHVWAQLAEALTWIRAAGGLPVLAHPGRYKTDSAEQAALLSEFKDLGGAALEVLTSAHTAEQSADWAKLATRYGLLASVGSDYHGPRESYRDLGDLPPLPSGCTPIWREF
jgi:predicted metal-dependent phosphoesterase TrpH